MAVNPLVACHPLRPARVVPTLAIDIGGSAMKAAIVDRDGTMLTEVVRIDTPVGAHPDAIVELLGSLVRELPEYDRIAVGFPGMVRDGAVLTAPNLRHDAWRGYRLAEALSASLGKPARVAN